MTEPSTQDWEMIQIALDEAQRAVEKGEAGVGAVLTLRNEILAVTHNMYEETRDKTAHAEMIALRQQARRLDSLKPEELASVTVYVTLEPCLMCLSAISFVGIKRVVFSAFNKDASEEAWIARGLDSETLNPLLVKGALELVEGVKRDAGKKLLKEMGKSA
jgi:tRNA(adenine34) deaminase